MPIYYLDLGDVGEADRDAATAEDALPDEGLAVVLDPRLGGVRGVVSIRVLVERVGQAPGWRALHDVVTDLLAERITEETGPNRERLLRYEGAEVLAHGATVKVVAESSEWESLVRDVDPRAIDVMLLDGVPGIPASRGKARWYRCVNGHEAYRRNAEGQPCQVCGRALHQVS
jgi:hypothetical protein